MDFVDVGVPTEDYDLSRVHGVDRRAATLGHQHLALRHAGRGRRPGSAGDPARRHRDPGRLDRRRARRHVRGLEFRHGQRQLLAHLVRQRVRDRRDRSDGQLPSPARGSAGGAALARRSGRLPVRAGRPGWTRTGGSSTSGAIRTGARRYAVRLRRFLPQRRTSTPGPSSDPPACSGWASPKEALFSGPVLRRLHRLLRPDHRRGGRHRRSGASWPTCRPRSPSRATASSAA